jgi:hypothetical protein
LPAWPRLVSDRHRQERGVDCCQQTTGRELNPAVLALYRLRW